MAIITAKFASVCPNCANRIAPGSQVEWSKGEKARHIDCASAAAPAAKPRRPHAPRGPRFPETAPEPGAHLINGRRDGRDDARFDVGMVLHAPKIATLGGGPDGHYYVVLACRLDRPCEDNGEYDWREHAWVRAATAEEAESKAAEIRRANAPKTVTEYVYRTVQAGERVSEKESRDALPADADVRIDTPKGDLHVIALAGDTVVGYHGGYYDDYRAKAWRCPATPTLAFAIRALASGKPDDLAVAADAIAEIS